MGRDFGIQCLSDTMNILEQLTLRFRFGISDVLLKVLDLHVMLHLEAEAPDGCQNPRLTLRGVQFS